MVSKIGTEKKGDEMIKRDLREDMEENGQKWFKY